MGFEFRWVRLSNHDIQFNAVSAFDAIKEDLGPHGGGFETTALVVLKIVRMTAFEIAFETFGIGLFQDESTGTAVTTCGDPSTHAVSDS